MSGRSRLIHFFSQALGRLGSILAPADFVIRHRPGVPVAVKGRVARAKVPGIAEFFARDLDPPGALTVWGIWGGPPGKGTRALRLRFAGRIGPRDRQRVRNYLVEHLG